MYFYELILISSITKPPTHGKEMAKKKRIKPLRDHGRFRPGSNLGRVSLMEDKKKVKLTATVAGSG